MINAELCKKFASEIKKLHKGTTANVNYKGTGSKSNQRQLWVRFPNGVAVDVWFYEDHVQVGGVIDRCGRAKVMHSQFNSDMQQVAEGMARLTSKMCVIPRVDPGVIAP